MDLFELTQPSTPTGPWEKLRDHKRNERVRAVANDRQSFHLKFPNTNPDVKRETDTVRVEGITRVHPRVFWPDYKYMPSKMREDAYVMQLERERVTKSAHALAAHRKKKEEPRAFSKVSGKMVETTFQFPRFRDMAFNGVESPTKKRRRGKGRGLRGKRRAGLTLGKQVHMEIKRCIKSDKDIDTMAHQLHPHTVLFFEELRQNNLEAVDAEFVIYDEDARVGTRCDVVCVHKPTNKLVPVEVKTGYFHHMYRYTGTMRAPFQNVTNCAFNQAMAQIGFVCAALSKKYRVPTMMGLLIVVDETKSASFTLAEHAPWFCKAYEMYYRCLKTGVENVRENKAAYVKRKKGSTKKRAPVKRASASKLSVSQRLRASIANQVRKARAQARAAKRAAVGVNG